MIKQYSLITLLLLGAVGLSGCGTWLDRKLPSVEVAMRGGDSKALTSAVEGYQPVQTNSLAPPSAYIPGGLSNNSSVEIYDGAPGGTMAMGGPTMAPYAQANMGMQNYASPQQIQTGDSSVTVFSLDGPPPGQMPMGVQSGTMMPSYGGGNYAPYMGQGGNQIFFKHGSARLGSGDMRKISSVAEQAKFAPVNRITVAGHASKPTQAGSQSVQGHVLNLKESMNRSFAVSKTLMKKGVPAEKIKTVSWGSTKPTGNESQDRRVDIIMGEQ